MDIQTNVNDFMVMKLTGQKIEIASEILLTLNNNPAILNSTEEVNRVTF